MKQTARMRALVSNKLLRGVLNALTGFALVLMALPGYPAQCEILPYANQCQGSNLWPVPTGWLADNDGDCQPQAPQKIPAWYRGYVILPNGPCDARSIRTQPYPTKDGPVNESCQSLDSIYAYLVSNSCPWPLYWKWNGGYDWYYGSCLGTRYQDQSYTSVLEYNDTRSAGPILQDTCPSGYFYSGWDYEMNQYTCALGVANITKPSDGICTQRRMPDGSLQQDPLDPDCAGVTQCTDAGKNLGQPCPQVGDTIR